MHPTMQQFMTTSPSTIGADQTVDTARRMMDELGVRHLPVRSHGNLVGIVARSDLRGLSSAEPVVLAMRRDPIVCTPDARVTDIASVMADQRKDAAIIVSGARVVGIFTSVDAARLLANALDMLSDHGACLPD